MLPVTVVRPSSAWPFNVSLVGVGHDTLAAVAGVLRLDPGYAVRLGVLVLPNLTGAFICAPILARIPVRGPAPVQDTLYLLSDAVPTGQFGPVC